MLLVGVVILAGRTHAAPESTVDSFGDSVSASDLEYFGLTPAEEESKGKLSGSLFIDTRYDSNIFISNTGERGDFVTLIKPYITYETNPDNLSSRPHSFGIYYSPEFLLFASTDSENAINHSAQAAYRYQGKKSFLRLTHRFRQSSGAQLDIGSRSNLLRHVTKLDAGVEFLEDYSLLYGATQNLRYFDNQNDRHDWNLYAFLMKEVTDDLQLGVGGRGGWVDTALSPNQTYQQALGRAIYQLRKSLTLDLQAGVDFRQFDEGFFSINDRSEFVYNARLGWQILDTTLLSLSSYRSVVSSSGLNAANYTLTGVRADLTQEISDTVALKLGGGYENADYYSTITNRSTNLEFDYFFLRPALSWSPTEKLLFELYYRFGQNDSSVALRDFDRHQVGLQTTIQF